MKKLILTFAIVLGVLAIASSVCFAQTASKTFVLSATVPGATGISISAYNVNAASGNATLVTGTALSFDPLIYDPVNQIWLPDHYFYINVEATGGMGTPTTTVTFTQGNNPNGANGNGLGWKGNLDYTKFEYATGNVIPIPAHPKELLKDVNGDVVLPTQLVGGYLRLYTGINDGGSGMPAGGEVFSNSDAPGTYEGTLLVSSTL